MLFFWFMFHCLFHAGLVQDYPKHVYSNIEMSAALLMTHSCSMQINFVSRHAISVCNSFTQTSVMTNMKP